MNEVRIDTSSFNKFARDLKRCDELVAKHLRQNLKKAGEIVAVDARIRAGFSSRIRKTIKVRATSGRIRVVAGGPNAPHANAFEDRKRRGSFRHLVYGNRDVWVTQKSHPYLIPALMMHKQAAVKAAEDAVEEAFREVGFRG